MYFRRRARVVLFAQLPSSRSLRPRADVASLQAWVWWARVGDLTCARTSVSLPHSLRCVLPKELKSSANAHTDPQTAARQHFGNDADAALPLHDHDDLAIAVLATARSSAAAITGVGTLVRPGSSAGRGLALGVLLASPHLAAARPFGAANTSVAATRRKLGYVMTDSNINGRRRVALEQRIRRGDVRPHFYVGDWRRDGHVCFVLC